MPGDSHQIPPVFIVGSPRSGTTFLTKMINRFLDMHLSRDGGVLLRFHGMLPHYNHLATPADLERLVRDLYRDHSFQVRLLSRGLNLTAPQLCSRIGSLSYAAVMEAVLGAVAESHGKSGWGNKRPSYSLQSTEIDALFPQARFLHIIRDARDVVLSMRHTPKLLVEKNWYFAAMDWRDHVAKGRAMGAAVGPERYCEILYEDLLRSPVQIFDRILDFVGGHSDRGPRLETIGQEIGGLLKATNYGKWKTRMPPYAIRITERVAGDLLGDLGYPVTHPELVRVPFSRAQLALFTVDRVGRNLFTRSLGDTISLRRHAFASRMRAFAGAKAPAK
jgi:hypothetical protein